MNTINNLLSNLNLDLNFKNNHESEKKNIKQSYNIAQQNNIQLPSLSQGYKFKEYQNQISENTEKKITINMDGIVENNKKDKEGFKLSQSNSTNTIREEYDKTLKEYNGLLESISKSISINIERNSKRNSYLNKYIRFNTGEIYYVTNKGVAKYVPSPTILNSIAGKNGCPINNNYINLTIPWSYKYKIPGENIPLDPPLLVGTEMQIGESCGYEGSNVYVSSMISNPTFTYKGCYQDNTTNPSMTFIGDNPSVSPSGKFTFNQCKSSAIDKGYQYFALQNVDLTTGLGYCAVSNDLTNSTKNGLSYNFIPLWSSNTIGQPVSYAILKNDGTLNVCDSSNKPYFTSPNGTTCTNNSNLSCNYFLKLQKNGNMSIYRGSPNTPNTTLIWSPNTTGKQLEKNNNYSIEKSKYGVSFLKNDQILNKGDWVVSNNGKLLLIMQTDGNLVLYTFITNCTSNVSTGNNYYGGVGTNPIYDIGLKGNTSSMGSIAYIDTNSELHAYPSSNIKYGSLYSSILENTDVNGNDIPNAKFANSSLEDCINACNKLDNCSGFVYDTIGATPVCNPKLNTSFYGSNILETKIKSTTFIRDKTVIKPPIGINNIINNIDSIRYDNYTKFNSNNIIFDKDITLLNSVQKELLQQLETRLKQLSSILSGDTNKLVNENNKIQLDTEKYNKYFNDNISKVHKTNHKIKHFDMNNNIDNMLKETEIKTLQENYKYMLWSIIAITIVLVAINVKK